MKNNKRKQKILYQQNKCFSKWTIKEKTTRVILEAFCLIKKTCYDENRRLPDTMTKIAKFRQRKSVKLLLWI